MQKLLLIFIYFYFNGLLVQGSAWAAKPTWPSYTDEMLVDVSQTLERPYLIRVKQQLSSYPFPIKVVYLPKTHELNLALYARDLFRHWELSENTMLMVVALDRRKIGIKMGAELQRKGQPNHTEWPQPTKSSSVSSAPPTKSPSPIHHLELLPNAVDTLLEKGTEPSGSPQPAKIPSATAHVTRSEDSPSPHQMKRNPSRSSKQSTSAEPKNRPSRETVWPWELSFLLLGLLASGGGGWYGWRRWQQQQQLQLKREKYALNAETSLQALNALYPDVLTAVKHMRVYQGKTQSNVQYVLHELERLLEQFDDHLESYDEALEQLNHAQTQTEAIAFFDSLESDLAKAPSLLEQAQTVQTNLRKAIQRNQITLNKYQQRYQQVVVHLQEIRTLHRLQLNKLYRNLKTYQEQLHTFQHHNGPDPLGIESDLPTWEREIQKQERDIKALPHIWEQLNHTLKGRIELAQSRLKISLKPPPQAAALLYDVQQLYKNTLRAVDSGDIPIIDNQIESLSNRLQALEALL